MSICPNILLFSFSEKNFKIYISRSSYPFCFLTSTFLTSVLCHHCNVFYQVCQRPSYWPIHRYLFIVIIFPGSFFGVDNSLLFEIFCSLGLLNSAFYGFASYLLPIPSQSPLLSILFYTFSQCNGFQSFISIACFQKFHLILWLHTGDFQNCTLAIETNLVSRLLHLCAQLLEVSS